MLILSNRAWTVIYWKLVQRRRVQKGPVTPLSVSFSHELFKGIADALQHVEKFDIPYKEAGVYEIPCRAVILRNDDVSSTKVILGLLYKGSNTSESRESQQWHRLSKSLLQSTEEVKQEVQAKFRECAHETRQDSRVYGSGRFGTY